MQLYAIPELEIELRDNRRIESTVIFGIDPIRGGVGLMSAGSNVVRLRLRKPSFTKGSGGYDPPFPV
ncbi:MAG TPA: hypothetical protein VM029_17635 [Opitutaceae bacterium]|nr:hypothetical protein [Opitutaceae bacterium]